MLIELYHLLLLLVLPCSCRLNWTNNLSSNLICLAHWRRCISIVTVQKPMPLLQLLLRVRIVIVNYAITTSSWQCNIAIDVIVINSYCLLFAITCVCWIYPMCLRTHWIVSVSDVRCGCLHCIVDLRRIHNACSTCTCSSYTALWLFRVSETSQTNTIRKKIINCNKKI